MRWPVVGVVVLLVACLPTPTAVPLPAQSELERTVADVAMRAWRERGLPVAPRAICKLRELRIVADVDLVCPPNSAACLGWRGKQVPVAFVSTSLVSRRMLFAHQGHHEMLHALSMCWAGTYDGDVAHADKRVWEQFGPDTAETLGERILDALMQTP
jgi:hypothetical protein